MEYAFLFETLKRDEENKKDYFFTDPIDVIKVHNYNEVDKALKKIDFYSRDHYLAGYFSYELGYFFEKSSFTVKQKFTYPLIHLAVFKKPTPLSAKNKIFDSGTKPFSMRHCRFNYKREEYVDKINCIKEYIRQGQTYQVNFTGKYSFDFSGSAFSLYEELKRRQIVSYASFCKMGNEYVISLSPELFFRSDKENIICRPMKGTIERGMNIEADKDNMLHLRKGEKNQAENLMIVDLIRNDLGRICSSGSVKVKKLFDVEKYNTLFQMTSTVSGKPNKNISYSDIFRNIFPGGSVTGAPKIRTMQIIRELEKNNRNIYCGALGIIFPGQKAIFNMPIRTISILKNKGEMGVGSGIVIDSIANQEFNECLLKANFLTNKYSEFKLIETILWHKKYTFLSEHLKRLKSSAEYFGYLLNDSTVRDKLKKLEKIFKKRLKYKVRLLLRKDGKIELGYSVVHADLFFSRLIAISKHKINPDNLFLYHKTTNRQLYDEQYKYYADRGYLDVVFLNKKNEVAEGAISNIIIQKNKRFFTPPLSSGVLPGIFREKLINSGKAKEHKLFLKDLKRADKIFLCNSVRGMVEVRLRRN